MKTHIRSAWLSPIARRWICAAGLALFFGAASIATAEDPGYFLSLQQKMDLLNLGRIQDSEGTWYDVWICPGYSPPARYAKEHLIRAGGNFHEYLEANKYRSLKEGSQACLTWALEDCGLDFTLKGIPRAWNRHFSVAADRTRRRVFGWWLAYPWALMESTVETAFRGSLGAAGTAGGIASGLAVVPAYHALDSAVAGTWNLGVNTLALPAVGVVWNTAIGPPLALVGQKPSPSRVDGFWVTIVDSGRVPIAQTPTPEDAERLAQWGLLLLEETRPYEEERAVVDRKAAEQEKEFRRLMQEARKEANQQRSRLHNEERAKIRQVAATNEWLNALLAHDPDLQYSEACTANVTRYLQEKNLPPGEIQRVLQLLKETEPADPARSKTDPVQRGAEVGGESATSVLEEALP